MAAVAHVRLPKMPDMTARHDGGRSGGVIDAGADPGVTGAVRLLHRRRGWAWTFGASLIALLGFIIVGVNFWPDATGAVATISGIVIVLLLALAVVALIVVIVDTVRLHRRQLLVRDAAFSGVSHHPVVTHAFATPVRHRGSHLAVWFVIVLFMGLAIAFLPDQVNGIAYLAGAGKSVTFMPQSYQQVCSRGGCHNETDGTLLTSPPIGATWPDQVPLGQSFSVRQPIWNGWGSPDLMNGEQAGGVIFGIILFDGPTILILYFLIRVGWRKLQRRRRTAPAIPS
jgi:hypothetical protein